MDGLWLDGRQGLLWEINVARDDIDFHTLQATNAGKLACVQTSR